MKPTGNKSALVFLAGALWIGAGVILVSFASQWLLAAQKFNALIFAAAGIIAGLAIYLYGFSKLVEKNLKRIDAMKEKPCLFAFMSWKSYLNVIFMMGLGITLRHSAIPKLYISPVYLGIGLGLFLSSFRYFKMLFSAAD